MATVALQGNRHILQYYIAWDTCGGVSSESILDAARAPVACFQSAYEIVGGLRW
jgi:hypothetical protein